MKNAPDLFLHRPLVFSQLCKISATIEREALKVLSRGRGLGEGKLIQESAMNLTNKRSLFLEQRGFKVMRFWNNDVIENIEGVLEAIHLAILEIMEKAE